MAALAACLILYMVLGPDRLTPTFDDPMAQSHPIGFLAFGPLGSPFSVYTLRAGQGRFDFEASFDLRGS